MAFFRERLAEVHEEYEERERRWNRIASLLDRDDLIGSSSVNTGNGYRINLYISCHFRFYLDSTSRSKSTLSESMGLINTSNDSTLISRTSRYERKVSSKLNSRLSSLFQSLNDEISFRHIPS